jgi:hypothetical protein
MSVTRYHQLSNDASFLLLSRPQAHNFLEKHGVSPHSQLFVILKRNTTSLPGRLSLSYVSKGCHDPQKDIVHRAR